MYNLALENFIDFCDEMQIAEESTDLKSRTMPFKMFGKNAKVVIYENEYDNIKIDDSTANAVLKMVGTNKSIYDYLYKSSSSMFDEINSDPYYKGKKITSGNDLIKAMTEDLKYSMYIKQGCIYFCGEYWVDPEHGFSIWFPNGKFVKASNGKYQDTKYKPIATKLGQHSDGL